MKIAARMLLVTLFALAPQAGFAVENAPSPTPSATSAVTTETTVVPAGTVIVVTTRRSYKSYGASTGTKVTYSVLQDAIINGHVSQKREMWAKGKCSMREKVRRTFGPDKRKAQISASHSIK